jgi:protein SCO1
VTRLAFFAAMLALAVLPGIARAGLTSEQIAQAALAPKMGATLPGDAVVREADGTERKLGTLLIGKPALVAFVDYTCRKLCGITVDALAEALRGVRFREESDYRVLVIGFNPADGPVQAAAFRDAHVGGTKFARLSHFLSAAPLTIARLSQVVGLTLVYDAEHQQFAHPVGLLLLTPAGRISRVINPLAVTPFDLRLALAGAAQSQLASISDHIAFLCYGFDAVTGVYTLAIWRILTASCLLTVLILCTAVFCLLRRERQGAVR